VDLCKASRKCRRQKRAENVRKQLRTGGRGYRDDLWVGAKARCPMTDSVEHPRQNLNIKKHCITPLSSWMLCTISNSYQGWYSQVEKFASEFLTGCLKFVDLRNSWHGR
jgi:hypothetical protein